MIVHSQRSATLTRQRLLNRVCAKRVTSLAVFFLLLMRVIDSSIAGRVNAADQPQWGERFSRNMVSPEKNLPASFDPKTG